MKTQTQLTELAEQKPDEFVQMIAEVCYELTPSCFINGRRVKDCFNPLAATEAGRSQAFELAVKFNISPHQNEKDLWMVLCGSIENIYLVENKDPQTAICIAAILTAQELRK